MSKIAIMAKFGIGSLHLSSLEAEFKVIVATLLITRSLIPPSRHATSESAVAYSISCAYAHESPPSTGGIVALRPYVRLSMRLHAVKRSYKDSFKDAIVFLACHMILGP